ncbi:MAG: ComF family protein [Thermomicrobiales bacterium]
MKFEGERARAESLGPLLAGLLVGMQPIDGLVPVPLHPKRMRERGFNQSALLASIAVPAGVPVATDLLVRTRPTRHQIGLGADQRRENVHGAFAVELGHDIGGQRLVLVDDVMTTAATLGNCADALKAAGAAFVAAVTVARE